MRCDHPNHPTRWPGTARNEDRTLGALRVPRSEAAVDDATTVLEVVTDDAAVSRDTDARVRVIVGGAVLETATADPALVAVVGRIHGRGPAIGDPGVVSDARAARTGTASPKRAPKTKESKSR